MTERNSFIFYRSFYEALKTLSGSDRAILYEAIAEYAFNQEVIELPASCKGLFVLIKPQLDANHKRFIDGQKGAKHGKKGGRPKSETPQDKKSKTPVGLFDETPNNNVNENDNEEIEREKGKITLENLSVLHIADWLSEKRKSGKYVKHDENAILELFKDYCKAKGKVYKDYVAAYRNAFEWDKCQPKPSKIDKHSGFTSRNYDEGSDGFKTI